MKQSYKSKVTISKLFVTIIYMIVWCFMSVFIGLGSVFIMVYSGLNPITALTYSLFMVTWFGILFNIFERGLNE